jgi:hypothetical protein
MPKGNKKGKRQDAKVAPAQTEDDFDDMLAEVCAADLTITAATSVHNPTAAAANTTTSSSSSSFSFTPRVPGRPTPSPAAPATGQTVTDDAINAAIKRNDLAQLRRWGRQGLRVTSGRPICYLAYNGAPLDVLRCLVNDLGADVNQTTKSGVGECGALHLAAQTGNVDMVSCLVKELGADINLANERGWTALWLAAAEGNVDMVSYLVKELGADVNQANDAGWTALWLAAAEGKLDVVRCLLKLRADVNEADNNGMTPLMVASAAKYEEVVVWLVKAGADTQAKVPGFTTTAAAMSSQIGASTSQTAYLEAKEHCSNSGCSGAGLKKCPACKQARYCGEPCQLAHWKAHKADCKRWSAEVLAGKDKGKGK